MTTIAPRTSMRLLLALGLVALVASGCSGGNDEPGPEPFGFDEPDPEPEDSGDADAASEPEGETDDPSETEGADVEAEAAETEGPDAETEDVGVEPEPAGDAAPSPEDAEADADEGCETDEDCEDEVEEEMCHKPVCSDGTCTLAASDGGEGCDDLDPCTVGDVCDGGQCIGTEMDCEDDEPCTEDWCDGGSCKNEGEPKDGEGCDDGDICTIQDACSGGTCAGELIDCEDSDDCTLEGCDAESGECTHEEIAGCGLNHPCDVSEAPTSADLEITACVCSSLETCCTEAWGEECVAIAETECEAICGCDPEVPSTYPCEADADCGECGTLDVCEGGWFCSEEGFCDKGEVVVCEAPEGACADYGCDSESGECVFSDPDDDLCGDEDVCTLSACHPVTGLCEDVPIDYCKSQDPCLAVDTPESGDPEVNACVCGISETCCSNAWNAGCVQLAQDFCGVECECLTLPFDLLTCDDDGDCSKCDDDNPCTNPWKCIAGHCLGGDQKDCPLSPGSECLGGLCNPLTGECDPAPLDELCLDDDICTADVCDEDTAKCDNIFIDGCGETEVCDVVPSPTTKDEEANDCVCAIEPFCCTQSWDGLCVALAGVECGKGCTCEDAGQGTIACQEDVDCTSLCDDQDLCNGEWSCGGDGFCWKSDAVICPETSDSNCIAEVCDPTLGGCVVAGIDEVACDDGNPCTVDGCIEEAGFCSHQPLADCSPHHPCDVAEAPYASDPEVVACACALMPSCCETAWGSDCIATAEASCGLSCSCDAGDAACDDDADCGFCDDGDKCNGVWICLDGSCGPISVPPCPDPGGCATGSCVPETGECVVDTDDSQCVDEDVCSANICDAETGECTFPPIEGCGDNHPCQAVETPTSSSPGINNCVCLGHDPSCCDIAWDQHCVDLVKSECKSVECDCAVSAALGKPVLCDSDKDCQYCDDGDKCNGTWVCGPGGTCLTAAPVECSAMLDQGCLVGVCEPETGICAQAEGPGLCDDQDPCTTDSCGLASASCSHDPIFGCSDNDPCEVSDGPGANDVELATCVCQADPSCCTGSWHQGCIDLAATCGLICDCAAVGPELLGCSKDKDCRFCDEDEDYCNGSWVCGPDDICIPNEPIACGTDGNFGCIVQGCQAETGVCILASSDAACDDDKPCTADACGANGGCEYSDIDDCDDPDPCEVSASPPGEENPAVEACVCGAVDPLGCCSNGWTQNCVDLALLNCGLFCSCETAPPSALTCGSDADCTFCNGDLCQGAWTCNLDSSLCEKGGPVVCDDGGDFGCLVNTCNPLDGACEQVLRDDLCEEVDGNLCTKPLCSPASAQCTEEAIEGCE